MQSSRSHLLDLPLELRLSIYEFALAGSDAVTISSGVLESSHDSSEPLPASKIPGLPADRVPLVRCEYDPSLLSIYNPPTVARTASPPSKQISFNDSGFFDATEPEPEPADFELPSLPYPTPLALLRTCHQIHDELEYHIYRRQHASRLEACDNNTETVTAPGIFVSTVPTAPASPAAADTTVPDSPAVAALSEPNSQAAADAGASLTAAATPADATSPSHAATPTAASPALTPVALPPPTPLLAPLTEPNTPTPDAPTPAAIEPPVPLGRSSYIHGGLSLYVSYPYGILVLKHCYPHLLRQARKIHICGYFVSDQQKPSSRANRPPLACDQESTMELLNETLTDLVTQVFITNPSPLLEMLQMRIYYPYAPASKVIFQDDFSPVYAAMPYIPNAKIDLEIYWGGQTTGIDMKARPISQGRTTRSVWRTLREDKEDDAPFVVDSRWPDLEQVEQ